jgi:hypothetical protein
MTTAPEDQSEREAFEAWARANTTLSLQRDPDDPDSYFRASTEGPWLAWNARAALRAPKVEAPTWDVVRPLAIEAGFNLDQTPNMLYTVRGNSAQLLNFARLLSHPLPALAPLQVDNKPQG